MERAEDADGGVVLPSARLRGADWAGVRRGSRTLPGETKDNVRFTAVALSGGDAVGKAGVEGGAFIDSILAAAAATTSGPLTGVLGVDCLNRSDNGTQSLEESRERGLK